MVGAFVEVGVRGHGYYKIVVRIDQLLAFPCHHFLHTLDVLYRHLVAGIGHTCMAVLLFVKQGQFSLLVGNEYHLVIHHRFGIGNAGHNRHQIHRHTAVVDLHVGIGTDDRRQAHVIHIHKAIHLTPFVSHGDTFVIHLEVSHRDYLVTEVHGEITVNIFIDFLPVQESHLYAGITQLVVNLAYFYKEVSPLLAVKRKQTAFLDLLSDSQVTFAVSIRSSIEVTEIRSGEKFTVLVTLFRELFPDKNILLVYGIAFSQSLGNGGEKLRELIVRVDIGAILLYRVLQFQHGGILSGLGIYHTNPVRFFHGEIDVLKDAFPLAASSKGIDRHGHAHAKGNEDYENIYNHSAVYN